jgi:hypothetical protein
MLAPPPGAYPMPPHGWVAPDGSVLHPEGGMLPPPPMGYYWPVMMPPGVQVGPWAAALPPRVPPGVPLPPPRCQPAHRHRSRPARPFAYASLSPARPSQQHSQRHAFAPPLPPNTHIRLSVWKHGHG